MDSKQDSSIKRPLGAIPGRSSDGEMKIWDNIGQRERPSWLVQAVDELFNKIRNKPIWEIVDFAISVWAKKYPEEHNKYLKEMKEYRSNRKKETGASQTGSMRELVIAPREIKYLLEKIAYHRIRDYKGGEKKFWRDFARKYPGFSPVTKI